tara:strand:- start:51 stop:305 length:255 start_codon:yes stop_codon:yes gene_type:complete
MERKNTGMKMLNLEEFMQAQISDRVKAMRKRERKRLDKIQRHTPARNPMGQAMWDKGHPVEKVDTKYNRKKLKKAVDIYRDTGI